MILVSTSAWVSAGLTCGLVGSAHVLSVPIHGNTYFLAFSSTMLVYNLDHLRDIAVERGSQRKGTRTWLRALVIAAALGSVVAAARASPAVRWVLVSYALIGGLYGAGRLRGLHLKQFRGGKSFLVASAATLAGLGLPIADASAPIDSAAVEVAICSFCAIAVNAHLCDVVDHDGDGERGVRSLPVIFGVRKTMLALRIASAAVSAGLVLSWHVGVLPPHPEILLLFALNIGLTFIVRPNMEPVMAYLLIDGVLFLIALAEPAHALFTHSGFPR